MVLENLMWSLKNPWKVPEKWLEFFVWTLREMNKSTYLGSTKDLHIIPHFSSMSQSFLLLSLCRMIFMFMI